MGGVKRSFIGLNLQSVKLQPADGKTQARRRHAARFDRNVATAQRIFRRFAGSAVAHHQILGAGLRQRRASYPSFGIGEKSTLTHSRASP